VEDQAAAAIAPDGSLVRLRRVAQTATLELQVAASADDAEENGTNTDITELQPISDDPNDYQGFRFTSVALPQGATILHASLQFVFGSTPSDGPEGTLYGEDADNSAAFSAGVGNSDVSSRTSTTATVAIDRDDLGALADDVTFYELAEVTAIVQEIVDRGGWSSGNALTLIYNAGSDGFRDFEVHHYDSSPAKAAKLTVTYSTGSPPGEVFVSRVASPGSGSTFSSWTSLDDEISPLGGVALAVDGDTLYAFMVDDDLTTIVMRTSTNHGASWSSRSTVTAAGGTKTISCCSTSTS
jgi:hypothetical protein